MFCKSYFSASAVLIAFGVASVSSAEKPEFRYEPNSVETGVVYQYVKSNIDGSRSGNVTLRVSGPDRIESLKWHSGSSEATLVIAWIDWERFSVRRFQNWHLEAGHDPELRGELNYDEATESVVASFGDARLQARIENWPWHSYDFDFASLNFSFRHLVDPKGPFSIGITDIVRTDEGPRLADKGPVDVIYKQETTRNGRLCREYSIDGPGLENRGGLIWVDKTNGVIVEYEIDLPDEPGFESGKLKLTGIERMSDLDWEAYKVSRVKAGK